MVSLAGPRRAALLGATAALATLTLCAPAHAGTGGGTTTDSGYGVGASNVTVTGDVSGSLVASVPSPPPLCYWAPIDWPGVDPGNPRQLKEYYYENLYSSSSTYAAGHWSFPEGGFEAAIDAAKGGQDVTWYQLVVDNSQLTGDADFGTRNKQLSQAGCGSGTKNVSDMYGGTILITHNFFPTGDPPEPVVDPEVLAQYAYEVMDLVEPELDWNPKISDIDNSSLVNLATWFWVEDDAAVEERSVTASAGGVSATVTANTGGVSITSPAGTTECSAAAARTEYSGAANESSACSITFNRASRGYPDGFPVAASTVWEAAWTSSVGEGGELDARTASETTYVPVVESQTLVDSVQ